MTADIQLLVNVLETLQMCIVVIAFGILVGEVVDSDERTSFKSRVLTGIPWLLVFTLLFCVFEYINNIIVRD